MEVPSIDELTSAFGTEPASVAETGIGRVLSLDEWPRGELLARAEVAGRVASALISPQTRSVTIEVLSPDEVAKVSVAQADRVSVRLGSGGAFLVVERFQPGLFVVRLRLKPDIRLVIAT